MRVAVAFDHRGVSLRDHVITEIVARGHEVVDLGTNRTKPKVDYPDKARDVAEAVLGRGARHPRVQLRNRFDGAAGTESLSLDAMVGPAVVVDATGVRAGLDEQALERRGTRSCGTGPASPGTSFA